MEEPKEKNAKIKGVSLTMEDHGVLSAYLHLDYGGACQSFGNYELYSPYYYQTHQKQANFAGHFIWRCMEIAGVERWEDVAGKTIRVRARHDGIDAIGNIIEDDWFYPSKDFKTMMETEGIKEDL